MNCPKCNRNVGGEWLFCAWCAEPLKEKCPECGKMEKIGRAVCETRLNEANDGLQNYIKTVVGGWRLDAGIAGFILSSFLSLLIPWIDSQANFNEEIIICLIFVCVFVGALALIACRMWQIRTEIKAKAEFMEKFPGYADILKKAKEVKNG